MNKHLLLAMSLLAIAATTLRAQATISPRIKYNFNPDWLVRVGDASGAEAVNFADNDWKKITLPYAWNEDSAFKVHIHNFPTGVAWYRKHFKLPPSAQGKKVFLEFEGLRQSGKVYLNDQLIGESSNGVMAFGFDITDTLKPAPAENVLSVRTDNAWGGAQWNDRNFYANYGGINKNVFLHVADKLYQTLPLFSNLGTTGVYVYGEDFDVPAGSAKVTAEAQVRNDHASPQTFAFKVQISEVNGKSVAAFEDGVQTIAPGETRTVSAAARITGLHFWSWGYGFLYDVTTTLQVDGHAVDAVRTRTGFRKTAFAHGYLKLNDRVIHLKGYAQRSTNEWPAVGQQIPPWMSDFSNELMVASNANLVRWMHVTPPKQEADSCDRVGLLQVMPAGDSEKDVAGRRWEDRVKLMRDAIIYHRNSPSIIFYESGNNQISEDHMTEMKALRDHYDPHGGRAIGSRNMLDSKVAEFGGEMLYINKSAGKPMWMMEYMRDETLRKYWDEFTPPFHKDGDGPIRKVGDSPAPYNRNQDSCAVENIVRWFEYWQARPGTGERVNAGGVNIYFSDSQTHSRGAAYARCSGEVDAMRLPKEGFYAHQVMWDGWVDPKPGIHIIGHWNYDLNVRKPIYVVSSAPQVELFVNNQSLGLGEQSSRFLYTWKTVQFQPGELRAVGRDATGKKLCETSIQTAESPTGIQLTLRTGPNGLQGDGADMALVDVEVVDARGKRCPTALNVVQFELQGAAEWRGGMASAPPDAKTLDITENYILAKALPVEGGINRVILRSLPTAGKIVLKANSPGLKPATLELFSQVFLATGGLSQTLPDRGLKSSFRRGPTPAEETVTPTRRAVLIVGASAGSNASKVTDAFDDNETTKWKSDGKSGTGWIDFQLERQATVSEVTLRLGQFKKSYPLRVTVDGKEAYVGKSQPGLGYCTLVLSPTTGKTVRIALVGAIEDKRSFEMTEVSGKKLDVGQAVDTKGVLEIGEAEIYEPLTVVGPAMGGQRR